MPAAAHDLSQSTIGQLLIPVEDLERAIAFYRDALGLPLLFTAPPQMSFFQCGSVRLLIGVPEAGQPRERGSAIYFQVSHLHDVFAELTKRGVPFKGEPHVVHRAPDYELWMAEFRDPDGNTLVLMSQVPKVAS